MYFFDQKDPRVIIFLLICNNLFLILSEETAKLTKNPRSLTLKLIVVFIDSTEHLFHEISSSLVIQLSS